MRIPAIAVVVGILLTASGCSLDTGLQTPKKLEEQRQKEQEFLASEFTVNAKIEKEWMERESAKLLRNEQEILVNEYTVTALPPKAQHRTILGAFGLRFGEKFQAILVWKDHHGSHFYRIELPSPVRYFSNYLVWVTPKTNRVYRILARSGPYATLWSCQDDLKQVRVILENKYGPAQDIYGYLGSQDSPDPDEVFDYGRVGFIIITSKELLSGETVFAECYYPVRRSGMVQAGDFKLRVNYVSFEYTLKAVLEKRGLK